MNLKFPLESDNIFRDRYIDQIANSTRYEHRSLFLHNRPLYNQTAPT